MRVSAGLQDQRSLPAIIRPTGRACESPYLPVAPAPRRICQIISSDVPRIARSSPHSRTARSRTFLVVSVTAAMTIGVPPEGDWAVPVNSTSTVSISARRRRRPGRRVGGSNPAGCATSPHVGEPGSLPVHRSELVCGRAGTRTPISASSTERGPATRPSPAVELLKCRSMIAAIARRRIVIISGQTTGDDDPLLITSSGARRQAVSWRQPKRGCVTPTGYKARRRRVPYSGASYILADLTHCSSPGGATVPAVHLSTRHRADPCPVLYGLPIT